MFPPHENGVDSSKNHITSSTLYGAEEAASERGISIDKERAAWASKLILSRRLSELSV